MKIPITQSREWQKLQDDLGEKSFLKEEKDYQYLAILKSTPVGNYLYCPYGPVAKDKSSFHQALKSLQTLAREQSAIFIRVEPYSAEMAKYLPKTAKKSQDLNPKETWLLDLTGNDDDLTAKLPSRLLRYYKGMAKKGITIEQTHNPADIHYLLDLQKALAKEKGINTFSERYLQTELSQPFATLYLVKCKLSENIHSRHFATNEEQVSEVPPVDDRPLGRGRPEGSTGRDERVENESFSTICNNEVIAAGLVFDDKDTRYNLQGAQSDEGRKLHATGILTIELIKDAKKKGLKTFDFWGIAPEGAPSNHPWAGFTNFKKTFQGYQQDRAGTYDIIVNPTKYKLYQIFRKANRLIRRS